MSTGGKKPDAPQPKRKAPAGEGTQGPSRTVRMLLSLVLAFHVMVLFFYPFANSRTSGTVLAVAQSPWLRWYAEPLYLHHGHGFFGPDPGPSFLLEYEVRDEAGQVTKEGTLPHAGHIWPRLRYHRFKMLADQIEAPHPGGEQRKDYMLARYAQQLLRQHGGQSVTLVKKVHEIVPHYEWLGDPERNIKGKSLDDPSLYREIGRTNQTRADVEAADARLLGPAEPLPPADNVEVIPGGQLP